eukprot:758295-Hanusia_phi.AAC.2
MGGGQESGAVKGMRGLRGEDRRRGRKRTLGRAQQQHSHLGGADSLLLQASDRVFKNLLRIVRGREGKRNRASLAEGDGDHGQEAEGGIAIGSQGMGEGRETKRRQRLERLIHVHLPVHPQPHPPARPGAVGSVEEGDEYAGDAPWPEVIEQHELSMLGAQEVAEVRHARQARVRRPVHRNAPPPPQRHQMKVEEEIEAVKVFYPLPRSPRLFFFFLLLLLQIVNHDALSGILEAGTEAVATSLPCPSATMIVQLFTIPWTNSTALNEMLPFKFQKLIACCPLRRTRPVTSVAGSILYPIHASSSSSNTCMFGGKS